MAPEELNVLHLDTETYWRGGQQQVFYLHQGLVNRGINSLLLCHINSELKKRCIAYDLPFISMKIFGEIDVISAYRIAKICRKKNIRIIQAHTSHALSIANLAKLFFGSLILIGVRRVDFHISNNFLSMLKYNGRFVDRIVCISEFIKKVLIEDGISPEKLITIRSGIDIHKFDNCNPEKKFRENLGINENDFLIGTIAAFAGHKDYPTLLKAFASVIKIRKNIKLCMVGDGPLMSEMIKLSEQLGISNNIIITGFRGDIGKFLKIFDLFILASKKEGLGTSIIDALSVGLPIIATDTGGIPELINDGVNGKLVEPRNPPVLADAIIELIDDSSQRIKLSEFAKKSAEQFSIENTVEKNIEEYEKLLGLGK